MAGRRRRALMALGAAVLLACALPIACADTVTEPSEAKGGPPGFDDIPESAFFHSDCGECIRDACFGAWNQCASDPECARALHCSASCPTDDDGDLDEACANECPYPSGTVAQGILGDLDACREEGAGANACLSCNNFDGDPLLSQQCSASTHPDSCIHCAEETCCETRVAFKADAQADAVSDCLIGCFGAPTCEKECLEIDEESKQIWNENFACTTFHCWQPCGGFSDGCTTCLYTACAFEEFECNLNDQCFLLTLCLGDCGTDLTCIASCEALYPDGLEERDALITCATSSCELECGGDPL